MTTSNRSGTGSGAAVSVIVPTHNSSATIRACLGAVFSSAFESFEVVVADDASDDETPAIAAEFPVRLVRSAGNAGSSATRNAGARAAEGRLLMFVDSDVLIPPDAIGKAAELVSRGACDAVVSILDKETPYRNLASYYKNAYMHYTYRLLPPEMGVFYTSAAAVTREAFLAVGGFDENYRRATIEDTEFGGRLRAAGYRIRLEKSIAVKHVRHYSLRGLLATGFARTAGIVKIVLRSKFCGTRQPTYLTSPRQFTSGLALTLLAAASLPLAAWRGEAILLPVAFLFASLVLNRGFLAFIARERGGGAAALSAPLMLADQFCHGLGALWGTATFVLGRRY